LGKRKKRNRGIEGCAISLDFPKGNQVDMNLTPIQIQGQQNAKKERQNRGTHKKRKKKHLHIMY
jgi:hypothetical protein